MKVGEAEKEAACVGKMNTRYGGRFFWWSDPMTCEKVDCEERVGAGGIWMSTESSITGVCIAPKDIEGHRSAMEKFNLYNPICAANGHHFMLDVNMCVY